MTVVVAFFCSDGVVVAADSMLTPTMGNVQVGHHKGRKVYRLAGEQIFAFAGDQGQAARFRIMAEGSHALIAGTQHAIHYPIALTTGLMAQFASTGISNSVGVNAVLAYVHGGAQQCCVFEGAMQPRLLDVDHYYAALGIGKLSADPFLRFLVDIFCKVGPPTVREAVFLATWTVQHAIETSSGGVAEPIRIAVIEATGGLLAARELPDTEIGEHLEAVKSAGEALASWRDNLQSGGGEDVPPPPEPALEGAPPARGISFGAHGA
jgi:20S proteasome alpha/beta subunit